MARTIQIKKLYDDTKMPGYAKPGDVALDMFSHEAATLQPGERKVFHTGFALEFPEGFAAIVKDKGGIANAGVTTMGGVFDAGYRGEYNAQLLNVGTEPYVVEKGDKIAQLMILPVEIVTLEEVAELGDSERGVGRFGSTGLR
ncbi:MAG: dUTP diphosphatase [Candidatus Paceibacterota bacterium]